MIGDKVRRVKTKLHGKGMRYRVRYIDPNGKEHGKSFPDREKREADNFLISVENAKRSYAYIDPDAGNVLFVPYGWEYLRTRSVDPSSEETMSSWMKNHLVPFFCDLRLKVIKPETINQWGQWMTEQGYSETTKAVTFVMLKSILTAAVENGRIPKNPCAAKTVVVPRRTRKKVVPWLRSSVLGVRAGLPNRYKAMVDVAAGCGPRQGEIFGLGLDDIDFDGRRLHIVRQVKVIGSKRVFGLPKNDRERIVPLPDSVARVLKRHIAEFPPVSITLPWERPDAEDTITVPLIFTSRNSTAVQRSSFNEWHWHRALRGAGVEECPENGMHALRHYYASVLIDAGESIEVVSENLGHRDPAFTWRTYVHLLPGKEDRTRQAIDRLAETDESSDGLGTA